MTARQRADRLLVARGLFASRASAQAAIAAGRVSADGVPVRKASAAIPPAARVEAEPEHPYVSRGGVKLAAALDRFGIEPRGRICLDVGASTGGFTQVLMLRGARRIYAVDVGRGQLHASLRRHPRIVVLEQTDIRALDPARLAAPDLAANLVPDLPPDTAPDLLPDLVTVDVSFISLKLVLPPIGRLLRPRATLLALIKPQFEAGRRHVRKGVVRAGAVHAAVCTDIAAFIAAAGWRVGDVIASPLLGGDGNAEFFVKAERG